MAAPRTRDNRTQLNAEIERDIVEQFQAVWHRSGRKRWEVLQDVVELGLREYERQETKNPELNVLGHAS